MIFNSLLLFFTIIALGSIEVSFLSTWPVPLGATKLILCIVIFLTSVNYYRIALILALGGGFFLELYSPDFFGLQLITMLGTLYIVYLLFYNFFTNFSFYTVVLLGVIGTVVYSIFYAFIRQIGLFFVASDFQVPSFGYIFDILWQHSFNVVVIMIMFLVFSLVQGRLRTSRI